MTSNMEYCAYWLHANGDIIPVPSIHIASVIQQPERFGYTRERIQNIYDSHKEPIGFEGKTRNQIMMDLLKNQSWIRVRYKPRYDTWVVELHSQNDQNKDVLRRFFDGIPLSTNQLNSDIRITELFSPDGIRTSNHVLKEWRTQ